MLSGSLVAVALLLSSTNAQRVANFDYFDFDANDQPLPQRSSSGVPRGGTPRGSVPRGSSPRGRSGGDDSDREQTRTTTPVPILQQINE